MIDQGIIQKIKKLLALASSDNENEAQAAINTKAYFSGFGSVYEQGQLDGKNFAMVAGHIGD